MDKLTMLVRAETVLGKQEAALKGRISHLKKRHRSCEITEELRRRTGELKEYCVEQAHILIKEHPAYPWFSRILGVGRENIGQIVGRVRVKPSEEFVCVTKGCYNTVPKNGRTEPPKCSKCKKVMKDPPYARTISGLWAYSGRAPDEDGKAPKRVAGVVSSFNSQLRTMSWRLGISILKAGLRQKCLECGKIVGQGTLDEPENKGLCPKCRNNAFETIATSEFAKEYLKAKGYYTARHIANGYRIVPAAELPKNKDGKRYEPKGIISDGHIHNLALNKMIKIFEADLWLVWCEAEGLPVTKPYAIDKLGHDSFIDPWKMCDR